MVHGWGPKGADEESRDPIWPLPPLSQCCSRTHNGLWNFVEPTPEGWVALLRPHTWGCWTLGGPRLGMKAAGALGAKVSSLAEHVRVSRTP